MLKKSRIEKRLAVLFKLPSKPSSPKTKKSPSMRSFCSAMRSAIARSKCEPFLGVSEGERFMMILDAGNLKFKLTSAALTRLSLSFIVAPARPTILNPGSPRTNVDSTSTGISASVKAAHFRDFISIFLLGFF